MNLSDRMRCRFFFDTVLSMAEPKVATGREQSSESESVSELSECTSLSSPRESLLDSEPESERSWSGVSCFGSGDV